MLAIGQKIYLYTLIIGTYDLLQLYIFMYTLGKTQQCRHLIAALRCTLESPQGGAPWRRDAPGDGSHVVCDVGHRADRLVCGV